MPEQNKYWVQINRRNGSILINYLELPKGDQTTVQELKQLVHKLTRAYYPSRQRLTIEDKTLQNGADTLSKFGIKSTDIIFFKDLGPQIDYQTVFLLEYLGPIIIHFIFYNFPSFIYGAGASAIEKSPLQEHLFILNVLHYLKREYETLFVHRFGNETMPLGNAPRNCAYYWILGGVLVAYPIYSPNFNGGFLGTAKTGGTFAILVSFWFFAQLSNLATHYILRGLRTPGTRERRIPRGYGFSLVSCPNYFFEILGWAIMTYITGSAMYGLFTIAGAFQMVLWAQKKHQRYICDFGKEYPRNRKIIFPFIY